tara:strand:+ start:594 stop:1055 length:462 start_codon:yes stop_codon:yes gene_type:complete
LNKYTQDMTGTGDHIELPDSDPEPERYYDWILWKLRQKQERTEKMNDEYIYESPDKGKTVYRRKSGDTERELIKGSKTIIHDMVNNPPHYNKGIETTDYINSYDMGFSQGNVIKYVTRYNLKHTDLRKQREDLAKAKWYLNDLIVELEKKIID